MESIRTQFPICKQKFPIMGGKDERPLIYLDHGASTHPPAQVLDAHTDFLRNYYSNIHRGNHNLSMIATDMFDQVEEVILDFIGADHEQNTAILTTNTTCALDMAAYMFSHTLGITLSTVMEHHSNYLPHKRRGEVVLIGCNRDGSLDMDDLEVKLKRHDVKLVAVTGASNVTGFLPDIHKIARLAHRQGAKILVDAAQLIAHHPVDVLPDDHPEHIDLLAAAGHKFYAPFGSAFLYGPRELFDSVPPYVPGGGTVEFVTPDITMWAKSPDRHQGGTPNIPGAIAMAEALKFLKSIGLDRIREHEKELYDHTLKGLQKIEGVKIYGPKDPERCIGVLSFNILGIANELAAAILNYEAAVATRNGCFCAHPYIQFLLDVPKPVECKQRFDQGDVPFMPGAIRATIGVYNTKEEMDELLRMVEVIAQKKWKGVYDLVATSQCRPIRFTVKNANIGKAACLDEMEEIKTCQ